MDVLLVTLGDPSTTTGGYLFHLRMADAAPDHGATLGFASLADDGRAATMRDARRLLRAIDDDRTPDVIVVDSIVAWAFAPWRTELARHRTAAMIHQPPGGIEGARLARRLQAPLDVATYRRATTLLMVASRTLEQDVAGILPNRRVELVEPGRDVAVPDRDIAPDELRRGRKRSFLCVGNWSPRKGILELLDAFAALEAEAATLHLVGNDGIEPDYARRVRDRIARPDLIDRVIAHGPVPKEHVAALYRAADAFVLPSMIEPYGTVYGEAMAFGLPVVGWRAGNLPHLARHEVEGLIVDPGDGAALSQALRRLAMDDDLLRRLAEGAARRAEDLPTWEQTAHRFFSCLQDVGRGFQEAVGS